MLEAVEGGLYLLEVFGGATVDALCCYVLEGGCAARIPSLSTKSSGVRCQTHGPTIPSTADTLSSCD